MKKTLPIRTFIVGTTLLSSSLVTAQNVGINATGVAPDASAMLDIVSANRGLLVPRVALTATNAAGPIAAPTTSLLVYNTATAGAGLTAVTPGYYYWDGAAWVRFQASNTIDDWKLLGNAGTTAPTSGYGTAINNNFIGTTDAVDFTIGTNGLERFRIKTDNATTLRIGMGTAFTSNLNPGSTPSLVHLHDWGTTVNDYPILQLSTASTTSGRTVGIINFASTATANEKRVATIESYLTAASATNATGDLRFFTNNNNSLTEKMRIEGDGDVGIGATPDASAKLDVSATNKGLLAPRVALTATNATGPITAPATSLLVYNTATAGVAPNNVTPGYYYWNGSAWVRFDTGNNIGDWKILGNAGTVANTNFVGTTDNIALTFRTNNLERLRLSNTNYQVLAMNNGSETNPFYSWSADTDMGIYRVNTNVLGFVTGSLERLRIPDAFQIHARGDGTAPLPFYSWSVDPDIGMYRVAANTLGFAVNGAEKFKISTTEVVVNDLVNGTNFRVEGSTNANLINTLNASNVVGFQRVPVAQSVGGALIVNDMAYPFEIGNDNSLGTQASIGFYNTADVLIVPETDNRGFVGNATRAWNRMNSYGFITVSQREKKRDVTPIFGNTQLEEYVLNSIDSLQIYFYKYKHETDELDPKNYTNYRPMMHIGTILDESPDFIKDGAFSGIDIYGLSSLAISGVKANRNAIKEIQQENKTITDFGSINVSSTTMVIYYSEEFKTKIGNQIPVITLSTNSTLVVVSVISKNENFFTISIQGNIPKDLYVDWIAISKKKDNISTNENTSSEFDIKSQLEVSDAIKNIIKKYTQLPPTTSPTGNN